jgi:hypothetical protein
MDPVWYKMAQMRSTFVITALCLTTSVHLLFGDQTTVGFDSGSKAVFDQNVAQMNPLSGGTAANGDGTVLQLGYYDAATAANNFLGNWVALTGQTSLNTALIQGGVGEHYNQTSIGDITAGGAGDATFGMSLTFVQGDATSGNSLPSLPTIPLSLRFYNATTIAASTFYNVVSDDAWLWKTPLPSNTPNSVAITLDQSGLEWLSVALGQNINSDFHTSIPLAAVPEPATWLSSFLMATTLATGMVRRRFKR